MLQMVALRSKVSSFLLFSTAVPRAASFYRKYVFVIPPRSVSKWTAVIRGFSNDGSQNELRHSVATGDWVVFSPSRRNRPKQVQKESASPVIKTSTHPSHDPSCPFCMGNEHRTPECVFQLGEGEDWKLRVVPNKYPVVSPYSRDDTSGKKITIGSTRALQEANLNLAAVGYHEVIIETPVHNLCTADQGLEGVQRLVAAWRQRGRFHLENFEDLASMMFFKNQGKVAGASLYHPHAQAVALPIVPQNLDGLFRTALHYFEHNGASVWEHTVHDELEGGERVVDVNEHFVSYVPYAAKSPYYMRIVPLANSPYFFETTDAQLAAFAEVLWRALRRLHLLLGEPDYNLNVFSSPLPRGPYAAHDPRVFYRWHAAITPRLGAGAMAGFEFGSGMFSNSAFPEDNAAELRAVDLLLGPTTSGSPSSSSSALDDHDGKKK